MQNTEPSKTPLANLIVDHIEPQYVNAKGAAEFLNTTEAVMRNSRHLGKLFGRLSPKHVKVGTGKIIYRITDLIHFVDTAPQGYITGALTTPKQTEIKAGVASDGKIRLGAK